MEGENSPTQTPEQLLTEGKKFLAAGTAAEAVESFQEACAMLAELHGQVACELAEPYYLYGKALLELARSTSTVLGSGIPVPIEKEDSDDDDEENGDDPGNGEAPKSGSTNEEAPESSNTNGACLEAPGTNDGNGEAPGSSSTDEPKEEEEETDLKLAWEILEIARVICQKQSGDEYKLKLADVQLVLAEVSLESDQNEQAIVDMNSSLQLRELLLEPHDRRIAEIHFNLGLAHTLSKQPDMAIKHYSSSKDILNKRKDVLTKDLSGPKLTQERRKALEDEISDITALLPDIDTKISDTKEMKKLIEERENQTEETGFPAASESLKENGDKKPVTDISHLVRKRVIMTDGSDGNQAKKPRTEENGSSNNTAAAEQ